MIPQRTLLLSIAALFVPGAVSAQVVITELMYDLSEGSDTGREWIEVWNSGTEPIELTNWKLLEANTNHGINAVGTETLAPGEYAVIADNPAKFKNDWPSFSGILFDSSFSLNNAGEQLILRCCGKELSDKDSVTYSSEWGGAGDGASLAKSGSSFIAAQPSPGSGSVVAFAVPEPELRSEPPPQQKAVQQEIAKKSEPDNKESPAQDPSADVASQVTTAPSVQKQDEAPKKIAKKTTPSAQKDPVQNSEEEVIVEATDTKGVISDSNQAAAVASTETNNVMWWGGAVTLTALGAGAVVFLQRSRKKEWDIVEEKE
ncbi:MAG: S-layer-like protein array protein [Parcubacteria group bacterium Gr01-1014_8]|nr:MAG: S-layer-like protein array protein [Parcubacteria group bacterium Gr01-1014_8]